MATRIAVMNDGVVQQVGQLQELYEKPDNMFVAGFIGSPAMNLFDGRVSGDRSELSLETDGLRVTVSPPESAILESYLGKRIFFGIRPEHIYDAEYQPSGIVTASVRARVDVTELMGNEFFLYLLSGDKQFLSRVDTRTTAKIGQDIEVVFDMTKLHYFDPDTGKTVGVSPHLV